MTMKPDVPGRKTSGSLHRLGGVPEVVELGNSDSNNNTCKNGNIRAPQKTGSPSRLPAIKERRPLRNVKKTIASSFSDASNGTSTPQRRGSLTVNTPTTTGPIPMQRRASVPQGVTPVINTPRHGSKPSFAGIGRRVSNMVRYKMAFQTRRPTLCAESEEDENHMEAIHEMPQSPRFSTFLSAEAQYAMMKGYEDKLFDKIADVSPEVRSSLRRSRTPQHHKVSIIDPDTNKAGEEGGGEGRESPESKSVTSSVTSGYSSTGSLPFSTRTSTFSTVTSLSPDVSRSLDNRALSPESTTSSSVALPSPYLKPLRRQSIAATNDVNGNRTSLLLAKTPEAGSFQLQRSNSLPTLDTGLSHSRRLVLTYRLESAMDILDTLKRRNMENSLSPRMFRIPRQVDAVKDFNSWSKVWHKEFKEVQA